MLNIGVFTTPRLHVAAAKPTLNLAERTSAQHHSTITTSPPGFTSPATARTTSVTPQPPSNPAKTYIQTTSPFSLPLSSASPVKMKISSFLMPATSASSVPTPDPFFTHWLLVWMPYHLWKVKLQCSDYNRQLTGCGIHRRSQRLFAAPLVKLPTSHQAR
ncbi:hypothetical protein AOLI_G00208570 [Acnodon oligacanthus]